MEVGLDLYKTLVPGPFDRPTLHQRSSTIRSTWNARQAYLAVANQQLLYDDTPALRSELAL